MAMRIVITGSRGLLGRYLLTELKSRGHAVVEYDLSLGHDVRNQNAMLDATEGCDGVVHLASPSSSILFDADPIGCWNSTLVPLHALLAEPHGRLIVPSSGTVYGQSKPPSREGDWLSPVSSTYAKAKLESERLALHSRALGVDVSICRIFTGYGGQEHHKVGYASQVFAATEAAISGDPYAVFGDGLQSRDFVHASDVATAIRLMLETPHCPPVVNIGSGQSTTVNELVRLIRSEVEPAFSVRYVPAPATYVAVTRADLNIARTALGFEPRMSFRDGLQEVCASLVAPDRQ